MSLRDPFTLLASQTHRLPKMCNCLMPWFEGRVCSELVQRKWKSKADSDIFGGAVVFLKILCGGHVRTQKSIGLRYIHRYSWLKKWVCKWSLKLYLLGMKNEHLDQRHWIATRVQSGLYRVRKHDHLSAGGWSLQEASLEVISLSKSDITSSAQAARESNT